MYLGIKVADEIPDFVHTRMGTVTDSKRGKLWKKSQKINNTHEINELKNIGFPSLGSIPLSIIKKQLKHESSKPVGVPGRQWHEVVTVWGAALQAGLLLRSKEHSTRLDLTNLKHSEKYYRALINR